MVRRFINTAFIVLISIFYIVTPASSQTKASSDSTAKNDSTAVSEEKKAPSTAAKKGKKFEDVVKDYTVVPGLFTFYRDDKENKVLMEILPDQFEKTFLLSMSRAAGDGWFFDSGALLGRLPCMFRRVGKLVQFLHQNIYFRADEDAAIHRAIERGVTHSIIGSTRILSEPHPERKSILIDASALFLQDIGQVGSSLMRFAKISYMFDKGNSYFGTVKSFPKNSEIETVLHFKSGKGGRQLYRPGGMIPDFSSFIHRYHFSLSTLPETGYKPRLADDRFGHFTTLFQDHSNPLASDPYVRYVERWDIKKLYPYQPLSPPEKPIVFWLENTIPLEYRQAVAEGILFWNKCFERIGIKDAIVVRQQPDDADWSPADIRYNTVQWIFSPGVGYAVGPSRTNPFTGQIYDADIRISADVIRYIFLQREEFVQPLLGLTDVSEENFLDRLLPNLLYPGIDTRYEMNREDRVPAFNLYNCTYASGAMRQAALGYSLLTVRGFSRDDPEVQKYIRDYLIHLVAHEVGHTLGLRHNFKASSIYPVDALHDTSCTGNGSLIGSVMDYLPVNIAPKGKIQGAYFQTSPGPWDYWAVEYAYKPVTAGPRAEKEELERIASRAADPRLVYGTDEDALGFSIIGVDPLANMYDLGSDPIDYYRSRIKLVKELWGSIEEHFEKQGSRYPRLRRVFQQGLSEFNLAVFTIPKYIGGLYFHRDHIGDPDGRLPFVPVSAEKQREALRFLSENLFSPQAFQFSPELLNKLAPDRQWTFFSNLGAFIDFPFHRMILAIQRYPLTRLYNPLILQRILDNELRFPREVSPFSLTELFTGLREAIWEELKGTVRINSFRRNLQRAHLQELIDLVLDRKYGAPADAKALARHDLKLLKEQIGRVLETASPDKITHIYLEEINDRIRVVLDARAIINMK